MSSEAKKNGGGVEAGGCTSCLQSSGAKCCIKPIYCSIAAVTGFVVFGLSTGLLMYEFSFSTDQGISVSPSVFPPSNLTDMYGS